MAINGLMILLIIILMVFISLFIARFITQDYRMCGYCKHYGRMACKLKTSDARHRATCFEENEVNDECERFDETTSVTTDKD